VGGFSDFINIVGASFIWVDDQRENENIADILLEFASKIGTWVDHPWTQERLEEFKNQERKSTRLNKRGFVFLTVGFILQLLSFFF
jgi:hypothetical protein